MLMVLSNILYSSGFISSVILFKLKCTRSSNMPRFSANKAKASLSVASEGDLEGFEAELEKLQRTYRIMENDRQAYVLESQETMRRHQAEIELLKQERNELLKDLNVAQSKKKQVEDKNHVAEIQRLLEENDKCLGEIEEEKSKQDQLQKKIEICEEKVNEHRRTVNTKAMSERIPQKAQKRIRVLENRLHIAISKFDEALTHNASLREEIETLRIERGKFQQIFKKSERDLSTVKKQISQVIEASTIAYDQRDEAHGKIVMLKEKAEKDLQLFSAEMKELQRVLNHDKRLREFMLAKGFSRVGKKVMTKRDTERKKGEGEATIEDYETAFNEIEEITGTNDISAIVEDFIKVEDSNFALFNFVNEQNNEIERLQDAIDEIEKKIVEFRSEETKLDADRKQILDELEQETSAAAAKRGENEALLATTNKVLDQLRRGVGSLFDKIGCDRGVLSDLLGSSEEVKNDNMMQYLGLIEQKANELLAAQCYLESDDNFSQQDAARYILGQVPVTPVDELLIAPPSTGDLRIRAQSNRLLASFLQLKDEIDSDVEVKTEDEESRPLTRKELKTRIMRAVLKKEEEATKKDLRYDLTVRKPI